MIAWRPSQSLAGRKPDIVAVEGDVLLAEGRDVGEKLVGNGFAARAQFVDGAAEMDGVPKHDSGRQSRGAIQMFAGSAGTLVTSPSRSAPS
jgi:hypothetical protein